LKVAERLPDEDAAEAQIVELASPAEAAGPAPEVAEPAAEGFAIDPTFSSVRPGKAGPGARTAVAGRPPRSQGLPTWIWIVVAAVGVIGAGGVGYLVATAGDDEQVASSGSDDRTPTEENGSDGKTADPTAPDTPGPAAKRPNQAPGTSAKKEEVFDSGIGKRPPPRVAKNMKDVEKAVVKIEIPLSGGRLALGTGFLIDERCWIATNYHVAEEAHVDSWVKFIDGSTARLAGIVAEKPEHDLAILELAEEPTEVVMLDISYSAEPDPDTDVRAFGHPLNAEFSLTRGVVSRVLTTSQLGEERNNPLLREMDAPDFLKWIQHDATIQRGNSGGPLLDKEYRVLGVNTWVNSRTEMGYASHVRYLRELLQSASGEVTPLPEGPERIHVGELLDFRVPAEFNTPEKFQELWDACAEFEWKPETAGQYASLADLANVMTRVHVARQFPQNAGDITPENLEKLAALADEKLKELKAVAWSQEHADAVGRFAAEQVDKVGQGMVVYGTFIGTGPDTVVLKIPNADKGVVVPGVGAELANSKPGTKILAFGTVTPIGQQARGPAGEVLPLRIIRARFAVKIP
jgi:S1-C subfamily serine protease